MGRLTVGDIMCPRASLHTTDGNGDLMNMLMVNYPALPVVDDDHTVVGIITEHDILNALKHGMAIADLQAAKLMRCGHADHENCGRPVTIESDAPFEVVVEILHRERAALLPVVEDGKIVGIITRTGVIMALVEMDTLAERKTGSVVPEETCEGRSNRFAQLAFEKR